MKSSFKKIFVPIGALSGGLMVLTAAASHWFGGGPYYEAMKERVEAITSFLASLGAVLLLLAVWFLWLLVRENTSQQRQGGA